MSFLRNTEAPFCEYQGCKYIATLLIEGGHYVCGIHAPGKPAPRPSTEDQGETVRLDCPCPDPLRAVRPDCPLHGYDARSNPAPVPPTAGEDRAGVECQDDHAAWRDEIEDLRADVAMWKAHAAALAAREAAVATEVAERVALAIEAKMPPSSLECCDGMRIAAAVARGLGSGVAG